jgi:hypothetical protein
MHSGTVQRAAAAGQQRGGRARRRSRWLTACLPAGAGRWLALAPPQRANDEIPERRARLAGWLYGDDAAMQDELLARADRAASSILQTTRPVDPLHDDLRSCLHCVVSCLLAAAARRRSG